MKQICVMVTISGPVSVTVLSARGGDIMMYLFGDHHFSLNNTCNCEGYPNCHNISDFITHFLDEKKLSRYKTESDVFMEVPFGKGVSKAVSPPSTRTSTRFTRQAGVLGILFDRFKDDLYSIKKPSRGRIHFADVRSEPSRSGLPTYSAEFIRQAPTLELVKTFLLNIMFGDNTKYPTKVNKQFHKLKNVYKDCLRSYLVERLDALLEYMRIKLQYNHQVQTNPKVSWFSRIYLLGVRVLVMDAYLLARMIYYTFQNPKPIDNRRIILYSGSAHTAAVVTFMMYYMPSSLEIRNVYNEKSRAVRSKVHDDKLNNTERTLRCININMDKRLDPLLHKILG